MEQLSFFEKIEVLFQNILAHPIFICILLIPILLIIFNKKITKKAVVLIYIAVLLIILFIGNTTIFSLFDNLVDGIFMTLYFPNFITLFVVEVTSAIICLITFLKKNITKVSKIINITGFVIIQTIFALILTVIQANDIDVYQENALYASNDVLTLMQLLMGTFALQIITLLVVKSIEKITEKLDNAGQSEVIEKHTLKLPEGRITHINLKDKVIIKKPQVLKEVVIKEPEIKIDPIKPQQPLNKTFLKDIKIKPLNVKDEISKEKEPKPIIKKETTEILEKTKPYNNLEKTLPDKIEALTLNKNKTDKKEKPKNSKLEKLSVETKSILEDKKQNNNPFDNFKPEYPEIKTSKFINKDLLEQKTKPKEKKELIANLQIVDFEKMIKAIKNLTTVYTM